MRFFGIGFVIFAVLELVSVVWMASAIGAPATLLLMVLCFFGGLFVIRRTAGLAAIITGSEVLRSGNRISLYQMLWPLRIPLAGVLLMLPGFVSTLCSIFLLLPFTFQGKGTPFSGSRQRHRTAPNRDNGDIIEGDFVVKDTPRNTQQDFLEHR